MQDDYRKFVQTVIDNIKKNGFPENKVAFPLEQMYEIAEKKGVNFNRVLETLDEIKIAHEKTPEKIIFYPKPEETPGTEDHIPTPGFPGLNPEMLKNLDPSKLKGMNLSEMMSAASKMMQDMSPEQLKSMKDMYENLSDDEKAALLENAKKMGLI